MEIDTRSPARSNMSQRQLSPVSSTTLDHFRSDRRKSVLRDSGKKQMGQLTISNAKLSIQDMIKSSKRDGSGFGIEGYRIPTNFAIHKNSIKPSMYARRQDWLTQLQKNKSLVPSPDKYEVSGKILNTPKLALNKSARITLFEEHSKRKMGVPPPNTYDPKIKTKVKGYYTDKKNERGSFTDDVVRNEMDNPSHMYLPKIDITKPRNDVGKMSLLKSTRLEKLKKNDSPSPGHYESPKGLTKITPNHNYSFSFGKGKKDSIFAKKKVSGPDPGAYNLNRSDGYITKGASKGWK